MASKSLATRWTRRWESFRRSILYMPTLITVGAVVLFATTSVLDVMLLEAGGVATLTDSWWSFLIFGGSALAASNLLAAIAGSWATIAGVVYSVTLVTIQLSATKYSAQVIPAFEQDRLNQVVLGAFTGTFVYSLLVLKTVRVEDTTAFVPIIGVNLSVLAAVVSLFLLILFIGNLTAYMRPTRFVVDMGRTGVETLGALHAPTGVEGYTPVDDDGGDDGTRAVPLTATREGYVAEIDWKKLRSALAEHTGSGDGAIPTPRRVDVVPALGARVDTGDPLLTLHGVAPGLSEELAKALERVFNINRLRDVAGDPYYAAETLGDIGVTALSGGSTDVGVAKASLRQLSRIAARSVDDAPVRHAYDLRVDGATVRIHRSVEPAYATAFIMMKSIVDAACERGLWDAPEALTRHVEPLLVSAADSTAPDVWEATVAWLEPVLHRALGVTDDASRARAFQNLSKAADALHQRGHDGAATELARLLLDATRNTGAEVAVGDALEALAAGQ